LTAASFESATKIKTNQAESYADDVCFIIDDPRDVGVFLVLLQDISKPTGLFLEPAKTEILELSHETLVYLGDLIGPSQKAIERRIEKARNVYGSLHIRLWKRDEITLKTKLRVFFAVVVPCLTFALETHPIQKCLLRKVDGFVYRLLRRVMRFQPLQHVSYDDINQKISNCAISFKWP
jgi:hypothetical protein